MSMRFAYLAVLRMFGLWVPKTCATRPDAALAAKPRVRHMRGRPWPAGAWDDLRLVGLKLIFLIVARAVSLLGLSRRGSWWKDAEILMLRHQLAVAQRERPRAHTRLTWPDRALLALLAGTLPIERLAAMRLIVTPGTIMRWHCDILRRRWTRVSHGRSGRPPVHRNVRSAVLRLAGENESWGYRRIHGELAGLGITVAPSTVWQILKSAGIDPAPRRDGPGWAEFLRSQAQGILALDFFTADLLNGAKVYVLTVIEHGSAASGSLAPPSTLSRPGSCSRHGTCSWTWKTPGRGRSSSCTTGTPASPPHSTRCSRLRAPG
jgi:transposase